MLFRSCSLLWFLASCKTVSVWRLFWLKAFSPSIVFKSRVCATFILKLAETPPSSAVSLFKLDKKALYAKFFRASFTLTRVAVNISGVRFFTRDHSLWVASAAVLNKNILLYSVFSQLSWSLYRKYSFIGADQIKKSHESVSRKEPFQSFIRTLLYFLRSEYISWWNFTFKFSFWTIVFQILSNPSLSNT